MSLTRIYSSKLYLTSNRKDKIHAAIQNPMNLELVQQVAAYLDDDSKDELKDAISEKEAKSASKSEAPEQANTENVFDTPDSDSAPSFGGGHHASSGGFSGGGNVFDDFDSGSGDFSDMDIPEGENTGAPSDTGSADVDIPSDDPVEEATEITGVNDIEADDGPVLQSGVVKKLLNDEDDAAGVVRVDIGDDETWIYYDDKVNLNDVLDNVISIIKSNGYDMLKFSRLARTDNAVVFDIKD